MKKTLYLFLSLLLCFALFACTQEPSTTPSEIETATPEVTPNEVETVTPNEVEVITPNEVETITPNEIDVVTPNEPEVSAKIELPAEPEENVIVLPEVDENTKFITIDFPEDFPEEPYTQPNLVSPEEFEWGEYGLFVGISAKQYTAAQIPIYSYALITSQAKETQDALDLYNTIDSKYKITTEQCEGTFDGEDVSSLPYYQKLLFESRIVYISEEGDAIGRVLLNNSGKWNTENHKNEFLLKKWNSQYDIMDTQGNTILSDRREDIDYQVLNTGGFEEIPHAFSWAYTANGKYCMERSQYDESTKEQTYTFYKTTYRYKSNEICKKLNIKSDCEIFVTDYDGKDTIVFHRITDDYRLMVYLYNIDTDELRYVESYACNATLSPCGSYVAYTSPIYDQWSAANFSDDMGLGFYIKNLSTNETVFYDCREYLCDSMQFIAGWVKEECFK